jgi:murein DD-endopeptidase MepM/ murein hydrolase activator NlpD
MRNILIVFSITVAVFLVIHSHSGKNEKMRELDNNCREICGTVQEGETFFDIFKKYRLDITDLFKLKEAAADVHRLSTLRPGNEYRIILDDQNGSINSITYRIDDDYILALKRAETGFMAEKVCIEYEKRIEQVGGAIKENLISSIGEGREKIMLALRLSDIFAWDIDFSSDLRKDDTFRIIVEGLYLDGEFRKYGNILAAEFMNDGRLFRAYRFNHDGKADYYDADGKALKKAFLKAPLNFRRISSHFSYKRFHPILRTYRPHQGLDYAAPSGTPVSSVGDGRIVFAGYKESYGMFVEIKHPNGYKTCYGHLSKIKSGIRRGKTVEQGQLIGYVGATGLATGPHLHYEIKVGNKPVNPLIAQMPNGISVPETLLPQFAKLREMMDKRIASTAIPYYAEASAKFNGKI